MLIMYLEIKDYFAQCLKQLCILPTATENVDIEDLAAQMLKFEFVMVDIQNIYID